MTRDLKRIKSQIQTALSHEEAEEGLYFDNLIAVHEEEERPVVTGSDEDILDALKEMISAGEIEVDDSGELPVFSLSKTAAVRPR